MYTKCLCCKMILFHESSYSHFFIQISTATLDIILNVFLIQLMPKNKNEKTMAMNVHG